MKELRSTLFEQAVDTMFTVDQAQHKITSTSTALLQISSCFGNHKASLLLATIYLSGLGQSVNRRQVESMPSLYLNYRLIICNTIYVIMTDNNNSHVFQGHVYSLIGAAGDNRFALMHAGYKHAQGIDGFPKDLDMAYGYLSNIGAQTNADSSRRHENKVCLNEITGKIAILTMLAAWSVGPPQTEIAQQLKQMALEKFITLVILSHRISRIIQQLHNK